jgi:hypothetical protein
MKRGIWPMLTTACQMASATAADSKPSAMRLVRERFEIAASN